MSYPTLPHAIGAIADAIAGRRDQIADYASKESGGDLLMQKAICRATTVEDMGKPSPADRATMEHACELARSKLADWWRHGRRIVVQGELDPQDLTDAPFFIRLRDFPTIQTRRLGPMLLEGAFVEIDTGNEGMSVVITAVLSGDPDLRSRKATLANLMAHQSSLAVFTSIDGSRRLELEFSGQPEIGADTSLRQAVGELRGEVRRTIVELEALSQTTAGNPVGATDSVGGTRHP